jgi:hypothetical protein
MQLDPRRWPERVRITVPYAAVAAVVGATVLWTQSPVTVLLSTILPGVLGTLIWRYDGIPWRDSLSWTTPLTAMMVVGYALAPWNAVRIGTGLAAWARLATFMFWQPPTEWWYRRVLRKHPPFSRS